MHRSLGSAVLLVLAATTTPAAAFAPRAALASPVPLAGRLETKLFFGDGWDDDNEEPAEPFFDEQQVTTGGEQDTSRGRVPRAHGRLERSRALGSCATSPSSRRSSFSGREAPRLCSAARETFSSVAAAGAVAGGGR